MGSFERLQWIVKQYPDNVRPDGYHVSCFMAKSSTAAIRFVTSHLGSIERIEHVEPESSKVCCTFWSYFEADALIDMARESVGEDALIASTLKPGLVPGA